MCRATLFRPFYVLTISALLGAPTAAMADNVSSAELKERLLNANPAKGERLTKRCIGCHTFEEGGKAKSGPNLWNIVGRAKASVSGFGYSEAMIARSGTWTPSDLDAFLTKPYKDMPGTKMTFSGLRKAEDRANLIAYLKSLGAQPQ